MMRRGLAAAAIVLAGAAAITGSPIKGAPEAKPDSIRASDLARHIMDGEVLRIYDLRDSVAYRELHLPGAVNATVNDVVTDAPRFMTVLYGDESVRTWSALNGAGHRNAFVLRGGVHAWLTEVLEPRLAGDATAIERAAFEEAAEQSRFFGGTPRRGVPRAELTPAESEITQAVIRRGC
jgi:3-mercaptopyruvate sulfurtransferase SseA